MLGFLIAVCLVSIIACRKDKPAEEEIVTPIPTAGIAEVTPAVTVSPAATKNITYYTLSGNMEKEEMTMLLAEAAELTPEYLVDYVAQSMEDVSINVEVDSVTVSGSAVIVSFKEDTAPVRDTGADVEDAILDAIAQSILENFLEYTKVIYRVMGQGYVSENKRFGLNHVYLEN